MKLIYIYVAITIFSFCQVSAEDIAINWWSKGEEFYTKGTAISPNGYWVYQSSYYRSSSEEKNEILIWDINSGEFQGSIATELEPGMIDISDDGSKIILAADYGTSIEIINLDFSSNMLTEKLNAGSMFSSIEELCFLPDNNSFAVWIPDNNSIDIYHISDISNGNSIDLLNNSISCVRFSPDGNFTAVAYKNKSIDIWDNVTQKHIKTLTMAYIPIDIAFSKDNSNIAVILDKDHYSNIIKLISISNSKPIKEWHSDKSKERVLFSGNDAYLIASGIEESMIWFFDINYGTLFETSLNLNGKYLSVINNNLVGCNEQGALILYDILTKSTIFDFIKYDASKSHKVCRSVMVIPNEKVISGGDSGELFIRDIDNGELKSKILLHSRTISSMDIDELGILAVSCAYDDTVKLWNGLTYELIDSYFADCKYPEAVSISPDGKFFAVAGKLNGILVHNIETGEEHRLDQTWTNVQTIDFSPDSQTLLAAGKDKTVRKYLLNEEEKFKIKTFFLADSTNNPYLAGVKAVRFSNDGKYFASSGGDHKTKLWDAVTCQFIRAYIDSSGWKSTINAITFSNNDKFLYTADALGMIKVFNVDSGELLINYDSFIDNDYNLSINSISLSESGELLTIASNEGSVLALGIATLTNAGNNLKMRESDDVRLYPNPAQNTINLEFVTKPEFIVSLVLTDELGNDLLYMDSEELILNGADNSMILDISHLTTGFYFLKIITSDQMYVEKFIKH